MVSKSLELKLKNLPASPGVYLFKTGKGKIIYIGKAKNLRNRVRSYFRKAAQQDPRTERFVSKVADLDMMVTDNEVEALILEANLVREHKPRYNIDLRDDKHFPYIRVTTNEPFPRVEIVRRLEKDGATYFGPYTNSKGMRRTVHLLTKMFTIRSCKLIIPHPHGKEHQVCLDYHIKRCYAPCVGYQSEEEYKELVDSVLMILSGKSRSLVARLTKKMQDASLATDFEEAARMRDQIEAVKSVWFKQNVDIGEVVDRDIVSIAREEADAVAVVMQLREGALIGRQDFHLTAPGNESDEVMLETFLAQYYNHQPNLPNEVILPFDLKTVHLIRGMLRKLKGRVVKIVTPRKGTNVRLVDLAAANARLLLDELLIQKQKQSGRTSKMVVALKDELKLAKQPRTMICFDISNTGETDAVGSCVYFENGQPRKNQYRHFKIKGSTRQDDYRMMREVIGRYFHRLKEESLDPPDLIVVDGGKGQLSSAVAELKVFGFDQQPIIGLAKRLEEVFLPGISESIVIPRGSPALMLLKNIRDEAHRFAINYNRKVRSKRTIKSALDDVPGIGPARRKMLLKKFGSVARIKELSVGELAGERGITLKLAENILGHLH